MPAADQAELDLEHITAVCDDAVRTVATDAPPPTVRLVDGTARVTVTDGQHQRAVIHTLRRVGYSAAPAPGTSADTTARYGVRVEGWDPHALARRLDGLTITAHRLANDLAVHVREAIDAYAISNDQPDIDAPGYRAAAGLRARLRAHVTATTGPHVPYDPDRIPADPGLAGVVKRVRAQEHRVDDLVSRTWLLAADGIAHYDLLHAENAPALARDLALAHALAPAVDLAKRDTMIMIMEWAREHGHGDGIPYAHWYANTYGRCEDGPDVAAAYTSWHRHTSPGEHPAAVASHDTPPGTQAGQAAIDTSQTTDDYRTCERITARHGRRTS